VIAFRKGGAILRVVGRVLVPKVQTSPAVLHIVNRKFAHAFSLQRAVTRPVEPTDVRRVSSPHFFV
jgi:hypothetical protein